MSLFLVICFIEALLGHDAREDLLAYVDVHLRSKLGISLVNHGDAYASVCRNRAVAGSHDAHLHSVNLHRIACTRNSLVLKFDSDDLPCQTGLLLGYDSIASDEIS